MIFVVRLLIFLSFLFLVHALNICFFVCQSWMIHVLSAIVGLFVFLKYIKKLKDYIPSYISCMLSGLFISLFLLSIMEKYYILNYGIKTNAYVVSKHVEHKKTTNYEDLNRKPFVRRRGVTPNTVLKIEYLDENGIKRELPSDAVHFPSLRQKGDLLTICYLPNRSHKACVVEIKEICYPSLWPAVLSFLSLLFAIKYTRYLNRLQTHNQASS